MKTSSELRLKVWINQSTCGLNCLVGKREGVGEILDRGTWISFNLSYSPGPRVDFKAVQVPTGKPALPEKQVGRSLRTCWQTPCGWEDSLWSYAAFIFFHSEERGALTLSGLVGGALSPGHPRLCPHCISERFCGLMEISIDREARRS